MLINLKNYILDCDSRFLEDDDAEEQQRLINEFKNYRTSEKIFHNSDQDIDPKYNKY